jgi:hypothetical protein
MREKSALGRSILCCCICFCRCGAEGPLAAAAATQDCRRWCVDTCCCCCSTTRGLIGQPKICTLHLPDVEASNPESCLVCIAEPAMLLLLLLLLSLLLTAGYYQDGRRSQSQLHTLDKPVNYITSSQHACPHSWTYACQVSNNDATCT